MTEPYVDRRPWYFRVPFVSTSASAANLEADSKNAHLTPEATANWYNIVTFGWLDSIMAIGYARPLEKSDLYKLPSSRDSAKYAKRVEDAFEKRRLRANEINDLIDRNELEAPVRLRILWSATGDATRKREEWLRKLPRAEPSLALALNDSIFWWLWIGGILKLIADVGTVMVPLLIRVSGGYVFWNNLLIRDSLSPTLLQNRTRNTGNPMLPHGEEASVWHWGSSFSKLARSSSTSTDSIVVLPQASSSVLPSSIVSSPVH